MSSMVRSITSYLAGVGFKIDEVMSGEHEFVGGYGPAGRHPMEFRVTWGPRSLGEWVKRDGGTYLAQEMEGRVAVGGLCEDAPLTGTLELRYLGEHKIRYTFDFEARGERFHYVGEKVNIRPWNLPFSHTTCFGSITEAKSGKLVSRSVTYFKLGAMPRFLLSLRVLTGKTHNG